MLVRNEWAVLPGWSVDSESVLSVPCPAAMTETVRTFLSDAPGEPVGSRPAATVMLLRPGRRGLPRGDVEVFMLRRSPRMVFAPGALVFPGGRVDDSDAQRPPWAGPAPQEWAGWLGCSPSEAAGVVTSAVRELFEESGVLLAGDSERRHVAALDGPGWVRDRERLAAHQVSLSDVLSERGLMLRSDLLGVRGHWLTPEFEPRRYDTYFFTALVPPGQRADGRTTEAVSHQWLRPSSALHSAARGEVTLLPPTAYSMAQLMECSSLQQFALERLSLNRTMFVPAVQSDGSLTLSCRLPHAVGATAAR